MGRKPGASAALNLARRIAVGLALAAAGADRALAGDLDVSIAGIRSDRGAVLMALYDSRAAFENAIAKATEVGRLSDEERLIAVSMRATKHTLVVGFRQLPPGGYAVIVLHDENDNGRMDTGLFGLPAEGYGFSNNPASLLGPPSFDAAAIAIDSTHRRITIHLDY